MDSQISKEGEGYHAGRPGGRRSHIGFIHPASLGGWLVHLVERVEMS